MIQSTSAAHAKKYFNDALSKSDYYLNDQELQGRFTGLLADRLGISGKADKNTFYQLCDNVNPTTGKNLTPRTKEERTTGYDVNFHCPKSVSIVHALSKDDHILKAFESAVSDTLKEIEADSMTRVRVGESNQRNEDRKTGELIIAGFTHQTARPVKDMAPDCHLHHHAYIFNCTYDPIEKKIKAGQFREIKRDMPYYQARFHKRMADKLIDLGYDIRVTDKAFEIAGVPESVIKHFSKRTNEIGQFAKEHGITDAKTLDELGAITRAKKQSNLTMQELKKAWREQINAQITYADGEADRLIRYSGKIKEQKIFTKDCINHALEHSFERASVMQDRRLLANSIKHSIGERHIGIDNIESAIDTDQRLISVSQKGLNYYTTKEVLAEEREMVRLARQGQGRFKPLYKVAPEIKAKGQQGDAMEYLLTSNNQTNILRGVAGAGKTTSLIELESHILAAGKQAFFVTPGATTAREQMPLEGFKETETVAKLIDNNELQSKLKDQVLIVDEAGQLGTKDAISLLRIAERQNCRLIFVGDTRQHNAVMRGDALRVINTIGQIPTAEVTQIYRQRSNPKYLSAVEDLSKGEIENAFYKLEDMGAIKTIDPLNPNRLLVADYMDAVKQGKNVLVISPTRKQGQVVSGEIRNELRKAGIIGKKETMVNRLENLNYTEAEKADWRKYSPGQVVQFSQNAPMIKRGSVWHLHDVDESNITIKGTNNEVRSLPLNRADAFNVYLKREIALSKGDKIKVTQGGFDIEDKRLSNGQSMEVLKVSKNGVMYLRNEVSKVNYKVNSGFGHIDHNYCSTSHSAQGKSIDTVLIAQGAETFGATDAKQFYVSCSRGKESIFLYTDDKEQLLEYAKRLGDRTSAMELVGDITPKNDHVIRVEMEKKIAIDRSFKEKQLIPELSYYIEDHEPRL